MIIYECVLTLLENTFFSSREVNNFYQTEPLIGNYALGYALGFVNSPYHNKGEIHYYEHFSSLNERNIYITPAKFIDKVNFSLTQFNSISDTYWSRMDNNAVATDRERAYKEGKKAYPINYPQIGWIKMLSIGNKAKFYIISKDKIKINKYIRLGKFLSKAKVEVKELSFEIKENETFKVSQILNPLDLPNDSKLKTFDIYSINPVSLIDNATIKSNFYCCKDINLPVGMKFVVDSIKDVKTKGK